MRLLSFSSVLLLATLSSPQRTNAANWDLIYADTIDVTLVHNGGGISLTGSNSSLIVNKDVTDITQPQLSSTTYAVESTEPSIYFNPFIIDTSPPVTPILPNEAVGSVSPYINNSVLLTQILPGEVFRNVYERQVFGFFIMRRSGLYEGPIRFTVTMNLLGRTATYVINVNLHLGPNDLMFISAARVNSALSTGIPTTTWGRLKTLYR